MTDAAKREDQELAEYAKQHGWSVIPNLPSDFRKGVKFIRLSAYYQPGMWFCADMNENKILKNHRYYPALKEALDKES